MSRRDGEIPNTHEELASSAATERERDLLARANRISRICDELVADDGVPSEVLTEIYAYADSLRVLASNPPRRSSNA